MRRAFVGSIRAAADRVERPAAGRAAPRARRRPPRPPARRGPRASARGWRGRRRRRGGAAPVPPTSRARRPRASMSARASRAVGLEPGDGEVLVGVGEVEEVVRHLGLLGRRRLGRPDVHAPVDLHRVDRRPARRPGAGGPPRGRAPTCPTPSCRPGRGVERTAGRMPGPWSRRRLRSARIRRGAAVDPRLRQSASPSGLVYARWRVPDRAAADVARPTPRAPSAPWRRRSPPTSEAKKAGLTEADFTPSDDILERLRRAEAGELDPRRAGTPTAEPPPRRTGRPAAARRDPVRTRRP